MWESGAAIKWSLLRLKIRAGAEAMSASVGDHETGNPRSQV
jgi:hypothetical protein